MRKSVYRQRVRETAETSQSRSAGTLPAFGDEDGLFFSEGANLNRLVQSVRAQIPTVVVIAFIGTAVAAGISLLLPKIYTSEAKVLLEPREIEISNIDAVVPQLPANDMVLDTEVEALRSLVLINRVIDEIDLMEDPEFNPMLNEDGTQKDLSEDEIVSGPALRQVVIENLQEALDVRRLGLTSVIRVACESQSPDKAQGMCASLVGNYVALQLQRKVQETERADQWLADRVEELRQELQQKESAIAEFRAMNELVQDQGLTLSEQQLTQLNMQLAITRADIAEKEARLRQARRMVPGPASDQTIAEVLGSDVVSQLREQQAMVIRRRAELATRYRPAHPEMQKVQSELADIEQQITAETSRIMTNLSNEVAVARERAESLERSIKDQAESLGANAQIVAELQELQQEAQATRETYFSFLSRAKSIADQGDIQSADSRIISQATLPAEPTRPNRKLIVAAAAVFFGLVGIGAAVARDAADQRVRRPDDLNRMTGLMHLGSIPLVREPAYKDAPHRLLMERGSSIFSEAFEELNTRLQSKSGPRPPRAVLFTSANAAEGKTTSALCFALSAARSGRRVVLIEADLRCPVLTNVMDLKGLHSENLKDILDGQLDWDEVAWIEPQTGLRVVPMNDPSNDPVAHLGSHRFEELMDDLRAEFDIVVIDTAPVLPVSDALKLMPYADKVVFVVHWHATQRAAAQTAIRKIREVGGDFAGAILTFVDAGQRWRFGDIGLPQAGGKNRRYYRRPE